MPVFVTGGTGFIGRYVVGMLLERGETVHLLVRRPHDIPMTHSDRLNVFAGDVENIESVRRALAGCDRVCHMAAYAKVWAKDPSVFHRVNLIGTSNVLTCAKEAGVSSFVHTSSCSAIRIPEQGDGDETDFALPDEFLTEYARSKHFAAQEVLKYARDGLRAVLVYPTRVYGPGPLNDANGATKALHLYLRNRLPLPRSMLNQVANWAFVVDVARGHMLALEKGVSGEKYILGGENATFQSVLDLVDAFTGRKHLRLSLPHALIDSIAALEDAKANWFGLTPLVTRRWLNTLQENSEFSSAKAARDLGYRITSLQNGLRQTIEWLITR